MTDTDRKALVRLVRHTVGTAANLLRADCTWEQIDEMLLLRRYYDAAGNHHQRGRTAQRLARAVKGVTP